MLRSVRNAVGRIRFLWTGGSGYDIPPFCSLLLYIIFLQTAKMKKWVALLGGAMFIVLFLSMYMVVDQLGKSPSYKELIDMQVMLDL